MPPSPRAKTLAHLKALVAAATATAAATSVGCGKGKAEKKPDDPYGSSGYAVVDPLPPPTIEKPVVPPSLLYTGHVKVTTKTEKGGARCSGSRLRRTRPISPSTTWSRRRRS